MSVDRDVVMAKAATVDRCVGRIESITGGDSASLADLTTLEVVVLNIQRACQASIDIAMHVTAARRLGVPASAAEVFTMLARDGLIDSESAARLRAMVGFRNIAVHDYEELDPAIVAAIVDKHLLDLQAFAAVALRMTREQG